jgi:hypothetical protein
VNAIALNGHVLLRPYVDYAALPNGLCSGAPALSIQMKLATARHYARLLR